MLVKPVIDEFQLPHNLYRLEHEYDRRIETKLYSNADEAIMLR